MPVPSTTLAARSRSNRVVLNSPGLALMAVESARDSPLLTEPTAFSISLSKRSVPALCQLVSKGSRTITEPPEVARAASSAASSMRASSISVVSRWTSRMDSSQRRCSSSVRLRWSRSACS